MASATPEIRAMQPEDWESVRRIYSEGISTGIATLEIHAPAWEEWDAAHAPVPRLVAAAGPEILGWAALSPVSRRTVYRGVAEVSLYVAGEARGRGIGSRLLHALVTASEAAGYWTLQASILAENSVSLRVHEAAGFRVVGRRERIGQREGIWRDTIIVERRSRVIGAD